jgi:hypothetical protein
VIISFYPSSLCSLKKKIEEKDKRKKLAMEKVAK